MGRFLFYYFMFPYDFPFSNYTEGKKPGHFNASFLVLDLLCISFGFGCDACWLTGVIRVERYTRSFLPLKLEVGMER